MSKNEYTIEKMLIAVIIVFGIGSMVISDSLEDSLVAARNADRIEHVEKIGFSYVTDNKLFDNKKICVDKDIMDRYKNYYNNNFFCIGKFPLVVEHDNIIVSTTLEIFKNINFFNSWIKRELYIIWQKNNDKLECGLYYIPFNKNVKILLQKNNEEKYINLVTSGIGVINYECIFKTKVKDKKDNNKTF